MVITTSTIPGWLLLVDNGDGMGTLEGTPDSVDIPARLKIIILLQ